MLSALDLTRLTAPDIAGAAGDAGEAADAASFASLLDAHGFGAAASEAPDLLPSSDFPTLPNPEDDPSRVNDVAFLVLTVAYQQAVAPPVTAPRQRSGQAAPADASAQAFPNDGARPKDFDAVDAGQAPPPDGVAARLRHLRLVASNRADAAEVTPADEAQLSSDATKAAPTRPLDRSIDDRLSDFMARLSRPSQAQAAQKQFLQARDAVPGESRSPSQDPSAFDAAAFVARRAVDAAWNAQVTQDRTATRAGLDRAEPATIGEPGVPRVSAAAAATNQASAGFQDDRRDAGDNDPGGDVGAGSPFKPARSADPIAGMRPLHTLVPVAFEVARGNGGLSAATTAAASALPNEDGVSTSIVQALRLQVTAGGGSATITLDPSYLGGVRVAVQVADGSVTATLHAANPQVRAWMEANESTLRQSLLDHGLTLDRLIVAEDPGADLQRDPNRQYDTPNDEQQPRQRRRDGGERFEVIV